MRAEYVRAHRLDLTAKPEDDERVEPGLLPQSRYAYSSSLEFLGQMVLPRRDIRALDLEVLTIMDSRSSTQQPLRSPGPEPLDHPEHTSRHPTQPTGRQPDEPSHLI